MEEKIWDMPASNFVGGWFIDAQLCNDIIEDFQNNSRIKHDDSGFRNYSFITNGDLSTELSHRYIQQLSQCLRCYTEKYPHSVKSVQPWKISLPYNIQRYQPDRSYNTWHLECPGPIKGRHLRHLTFMTYLNDIEIGGETAFLYQGIEIKPEKGLTVIWPAGWTHIHRGQPAPQEIKYISTGWTVFDYKIP